MTIQGVCSGEELTAFFKGFVQAHPTFDIIDVGSGKEKADHKIREHLDVFLRNPQVNKVFFGGMPSHHSFTPIVTRGHRVS